MINGEGFKNLVSPSIGLGKREEGKSHHRLFPLPRLNFHNSISGRRKRRGGRTEGEGGKVKFYFRVLGLKFSPPPSPFYLIILLLWKRICPLWCISLSNIHTRNNHIFQKNTASSYSTIAGVCTTVHIFLTCCCRLRLCLQRDSACKTCSSSSSSSSTDLFGLGRGRKKDASILLLPLPLRPPLSLGACWTLQGITEEEEEGGGGGGGSLGALSSWSTKKEGEREEDPRNGEGGERGTYPTVHNKLLLQICS